MKNVLYLDWPAFSSEDAKGSLRNDFSYNVVTFFNEDYTLRFSESFDKAFDDTVSGKSFAFAFSYNFYPLFAEGCHRHGIKYISLVYDSPQVKLYSYRITYPENYCFIFDKQTFLTLRKGGINTVYYCPLPVNAKKITLLKDKKYDRSRTVCDVSFVGSLYNEEHNIYDRMYEKLPEYARGYLDALLLSQQQVYGISFLEEMLNDKMIAAMHAAEDYAINPDGVETLSYIYADYYLARKLTSMDRLLFLSNIGKKFNNYDLKLFTIDERVKIDGFKNMGRCDYYQEMPYVFNDSRINLNISLRSIKSGIPMRCMDILSDGGFLLTNYQADMEDYFVSGEDYDYFSDTDDLCEKIEYYLTHEKERAEIAENGYRKALDNHSFKNTFSQMFAVAEVEP